MVEYYVDPCHVFQERMKKETESREYTKVQMDKKEKVLIILGHDECIIKQYNLTKKLWSGPDGKMVLVPTDHGQGVMISAFQCHEFCFSLELSDEQLAEVSKLKQQSARKEAQ